jgi:Ca2+-binding RTX toxin-like protein
MLGSPEIVSEVGTRRRGGPGRALRWGMLGLILGVGVAIGATEVAWAPPNPTIQCGGGICNGTAANDHMHGTSGFDDIRAREGSDIGEGRDARDIVGGGMNEDIMVGEQGNDTVDGEAGFDSFLQGGQLIGLHGQAGNDTVRGDDGVDTLSGGPGDDHLSGGADHDHCDGAGGFDTFESCHFHPPGTPSIPDDPF